MSTVRLIDDQITALRERPLGGLSPEVTHPFKSDKKKRPQYMAYSQIEIEIIANGYELAHYPVVPNSEHVVLHLKKSP